MVDILDFRSELFSYFWSTSHPINSYQVFKMAAEEAIPAAAILDFQSEQSLLFWIYKSPWYFLV